MKWWKQIILILLTCGLVAVALTVIFSVEPEPEYKGKKLSEWADIYLKSFKPEHPEWDSPMDSAMRREAVEAARQTRDKLLPMLLTTIQIERPNWKRVMAGRMEKMDARRWCPEGIWKWFYGNRAEDNMVYFLMLGTNAGPAFPELVRIMKQAKSPEIRQRAMQALACTGKDGLPPLIEVLGDLKNPDHQMVVYAIIYMKALGTDVSLAVPVLVKNLEANDPKESVTAAKWLGYLSIEPDIVVPELTNCLKSPDILLRKKAINALEKFGDRGRSAVSALVVALGDPDADVRKSATNALMQIAPEVLMGAAK